MTQQEFLIDTLQYYLHDTTRRCVSKENNKCFYSPINANNKNSDGCAIGRHLNDDVQKNFDLLIGSSITHVLKKPDLKSKLPEFMQLFEPKFLTNIQAFHDDNKIWEINKLSEYGKFKLNEIIDDFNFDKSLFEKYTQ